MNRISAWFQFARRVWIALGLGWAGLLVGLTPVLRLDRAGALLVCGAIVAEVLHEKHHRLFVDQIQWSFKHTYVEVDVPDEDRKDIAVEPFQSGAGRRVVNTEGWALYHLASKQEFSSHEHTRMWDLEGTMKRLENKVDYAIVVTAIVGTIFWAFGYRA